MKNDARRITRLTFVLWVAAAFIVGLAYALAYLPSERAIDDRWLQVARSDARTRQANQTLANARQIETARARMRESIEGNVRGEDAGVIASVLRAVSLVGRKCGVAVASLQERDAPKNGKRTSRMTGTSVTVDVRGTFSATLAFVAMLSASGPLLGIDRIAMTVSSRAGERVIVESRIEATVYRLSPDALTDVS